MQVYTHTADPEFLGFQPGSVFQNSVVKNLLPPGVYYYQYELVEGVRSMLSAALEGTCHCMLPIPVTGKAQPFHFTSRTLMMSEQCC